jgi:chaperone BCS1
MSDHSSFAELVDAPRAPGAAAECPFETECFDAAVLRKNGIDPAVHCWAEVASGGHLYEQLKAYLGKHGDKPRSFVPRVGTKQLSTVEEMLGEETPAATVQLDCGLGLVQLKHTMQNGRTVAIKALHQRRGPVVGGRCGAATWENLVVFAEGSESRDALQAFLEEVVNSQCEPQPNEYSIYRWQVENQYWKHAATKTSRSLDSVVLPLGTKTKIISDLDAFLSTETFQFYTKHGIPYKRSFLFYGVPGAGKTSMLTAIAGKYRRNLCIMQPTDPRFTDDALADAIKEAPSRSIIVLEDVDALFDKNRETKNAKMSISFSGLLNALDGIGNPDGQIFVLTTNFRENLDQALIRNGRVDLHVEFCHATGEQMEQLFRQFYPADAPLAVTFRDAVQTALGDKPINMAALQHFFIGHMRQTAQEAVADVHCILADLNEKAATDAMPAAPAAPACCPDGDHDSSSSSSSDNDDDEKRLSGNMGVKGKTKCKSKEKGKGKGKGKVTAKSEARGLAASGAANNVVHVHVYNSAENQPNS